MCIICNCGDDGARFLEAFARSRTSMKDAHDAMLQCSKEVDDPEKRARYDSMYKRMARIISEWNAIEHERERKPQEPR